jgi:hypothetical protein
MKRIAKMTIDELVERFTAIALDQYGALQNYNSSRFNRLFDQMAVVEQELKKREGDQRRALLTLYDHPNAQVRLKAATATLALAPANARGVIQAIAESGEYPQAGDAGMALVRIDSGEFKPN